MGLEMIWRLGDGKYDVSDGHDDQSWLLVKDKIVGIHEHNGSVRLSRSDNSIIEAISDNGVFLVTYIPPSSDDEEIPDVMTFHRDSPGRKMIDIGGNYWDERITTNDLGDVLDVFRDYLFTGSIGEGKLT
jgi:hypothetical protein